MSTTTPTYVKDYRTGRVTEMTAEDRALGFLGLVVQAVAAEQRTAR
jgi:hypothetical protein